MQKLKPKLKKTRTENSAVSTFINVQIFSVICYSAVFFAFSFIALVADLPQKYDYYFSLFIFAVCSFLAGFYAGIKIRQNGLLAGIIYTLPINTLTLLISLIFSDFKADISVMFTVVLLILSSAVGGVLAVNKRHRR